MIKLLKIEEGKQKHNVSINTACNVINSFSNKFHTDESMLLEIMCTPELRPQRKGGDEGKGGGGGGYKSKLWRRLTLEKK